MPRKKTRKAVLVETNTDPVQLPVALSRQGTFTKTPDASPSKTDSEAQENVSPPARTTRRRARKTKNSGSPPKPTRTMPRRGTKRSGDAQAISEEIPDIKENADPVATNPAYTSPKKNRRRTRRTKNTEIASTPEPSAGLPDEITPTRSPERAQTVPDEPAQKRSRRGKRGKESTSVSHTLVREGTFTKSPEKKKKQSDIEMPDVTESIQIPASAGDSTVDIPAAPSDSTSRRTKRSKKAQEETISPEHNVIKESSEKPRESPCKIGSEGWGDFKEETISSPVPQRRGTFVKTPRRSKHVSEVGQKFNADVPELKREGTFTMSPEKERNVSEVGQKFNADVSELKREGTFTISPEKDDSEAVRMVDVNVPELRREGTFTKTPAIGAGDIPNFLPTTGRTPPPIENMSVFQRLSSKRPLSERRSLIVSEKRVSMRKRFSTPQIDKKAHLTALRDARANQITPKSITFRRTTTPSTPVQQAIKPASSARKPKSAVKKPPNFAAIHERNFAKMESLMENRKRLRERANFFMSPLRPTQASGIPKLLKKEGSPVSKDPKKKQSKIPIIKMAAKERLKAAMTMKCSTGALLRAQNSVLKGVRTNKRFELLLQQKKMKI